MLIHLVRKDFLIVKKYVLLMLAVCVFIPPFMMWRIDDATYVGSMSFILAAIFSSPFLLPDSAPTLRMYQTPRHF